MPSGTKVISTVGTTLDDIARKAGVSASTVSRVLRGVQSSIPISETTRKKVLNAARELQYHPNAAARALSSSRAGAIALVIPTGPQKLGYQSFFHLKLPEMLSAVQQVASANDLSVLIQVADRKFFEQGGCMHLWVSRMVDGILAWNLLPSEEVLESGCPVLTINNRSDKGPTNFIIPDNQGGACQATGHLVALGHQRIAHIEGPGDDFAARERKTGYLHTLDAHGLSPITEAGDFSEASGYEVAQKLLDLPPRPTAIFAGNDLMAIGALRAIHERGMHVPQDVAVVGFDSIHLSAYVQPPLTTVEVAMYNLGILAAESLVKIMSGEQKAPVQESMATKLIIRESCGFSRGIGEGWKYDLSRGWSQIG